MQLPKYSPLVVIWEDCSIRGGWKSPTSVMEAQNNPYLIQSVGFLLSINSKRIILTHGYAMNEGEEGYQAIITIPSGTIRSVYAIQKGVFRDYDDIIREYHGLGAAKKKKAVKKTSGAGRKK